MASSISRTRRACRTALFFGVIEGVARPFREPGIDIFDVLAATAPATVPRFDSNPERIRVDSDRSARRRSTCRRARASSNLLGRAALRLPHLDAAARSWPTRARSASRATTSRRRRWPRRRRASSRWRRSNLERFFDTVDDPGDDTVRDAGGARAAAREDLAGDSRRAASRRTSSASRRPRTWRCCRRWPRR